MLEIIGAITCVVVGVVAVAMLLGFIEIGFNVEDRD